MNGLPLLLTIPMAPVTKKNSQRIIQMRTRDGNAYHRILPSKAYEKYEAAAMQHMPRLMDPISRKVNVQCVYYMPTRRKVDLVNLQEATLDVLVHYGVLEDDNSSIVVSMDGSKVRYDKANPRTEILISEVVDRYD